MNEDMIEENSQNFILTHSESDNSDLYNPWYDVRRNANFKMSEKFVNQLKETNDPRLEILVLPNREGEYKGFINGLLDKELGKYVRGDHSTPAPILYEKDHPLYLMCESEVSFLTAENALFDLITVDPQEFYEKRLRLA